MLGEIRSVLEAHSGGETGVSVVRIPDQDWNVVWAQSIRPVRIGRRVVVRQSWNLFPAAPGDFFSAGPRRQPHLLLLGELEELALREDLRRREEGEDV